MSLGYRRAFARLTAARERLLELRASRIEQLLRLRTYLRGELAEFVATLDPITGVRFAEIRSEGSKANGDLSLTIAFFEGTTLRLGVDREGTFVCGASPPEMLAGIGRIYDLRVRGDAGYAEFDYEPEGEPGARRSGNFGELAMRLVDRAVAAAERDVDRIPERGIAFAAQIAEAARARGGLGFSIG
jgi:hypothetical protein